MSFIVDIIAMTFGRPHALFPAVGALVIGGGAVTVGILTAAGAVGTLVCSLFWGRIGLVRRHGVAIGWSIGVYGAFVAGFGAVLAWLSLSGGARHTPSIEGADITALVLAAVMMAGTGAADNVSSIFRNTMLQSAVPDNMRGRLQGIFTVVVAGGPRVGDFYVGAAALVVAVWVPPLLGGLLIMVLIALCVRVAPSFRAYDAHHPTP
jgi:MFS family permease